MNAKEYALIVAGGQGTRMKSGIPKQFMLLRGRPVLMHTIDAFLRYSVKINIVLVLSENDFTTWTSLCEHHDFHPTLALQKGGDSRFESVRNGLTKIEGAGLVAIHDGVRPLVSVEIIADSFKLAALHGSAVAAVALKESIRKISAGGTEGVDRAQYRVIQTPQTFEVGLIRKAYTMPEDPGLTDDASVAERAGNKIFLFEGKYENLKITTPEDLIVAEALLGQKAIVPPISIRPR